MPGAAPPPSKSKAPLVIIGLVIVALIIGGVVLVTRKDSNSGGSAGGDAKAAHTALRDILNNAEFDTTGNAPLEACPLGTVKALDALVTAKVALDKALIRADDTATAKDSTDVKPQRVSCDQSVDDPSDVDSGPAALSYGALLNPPKDIDAYLKDSGSDSGKVTIGATSSFKGGTIHSACVDASKLTSCVGLWVDETDRIAIGVAVIGDGIAAKDSVAATKAIVPSALKSLAASGADAGSSDSSDTTDTTGS